MSITMFAARGTWYGETEERDFHVRAIAVGEWRIHGAVDDVDEIRIGHRCGLHVHTCTDLDAAIAIVQELEPITTDYSNEMIRHIVYLPEEQRPADYLAFSQDAKAAIARALAALHEESDVCVERTWQRLINEESDVSRD